VEKTKDYEPTWRCDALQGILKEAHSLFAMFHGPIRTSLDRQPSAELARGHLRTFLTDYLSGGSCFPLILCLSGLSSLFHGFIKLAMVH
jgi:hypothetical protein